MRVGCVFGGTGRDSWERDPHTAACLDPQLSLVLPSTSILLCELRQAQSAAPLFHPLTSSLEKPDSSITTQCRVQEALPAPGWGRRREAG